MLPLTIFARRELTTDSATHCAQAIDRKAGLKVIPRFDVQCYHDRECQSKAGRITWYYSNCPTKRNKWLMLNCYRYRLEWVD